MARNGRPNNMQLALTWTTTRCERADHTEPIPACTWRLPNGLTTTMTICAACAWRAGFISYDGRVTRGAATPSAWYAAVRAAKRGQPFVTVSRADWTTWRRELETRRRHRFRERCADLGYRRAEGRA